MSEVAEEAMEDEQQGASPDHDDAAPKRSPSKVSGRSKGQRAEVRGWAELAAVGDIIEGKRTKKTVERLDFQAPKQMEKLRIGDGSGEKLGDIPRTGYQITKMKPADLKPLHTILFDRQGKIATIKRNLRLFNGFPFLADSDQYSKKRDKLLKSSHFTNSKLKVVCSVLDLEKKGTHSDLVDRILNFLVAPKNSGKRLPVKKKRKSKKKLSGEDSAAKTKKKKSSSSSSSSSKKPKSSSPKKTGSKSKAIVMDSSTDEEQEEEEEDEDDEEEEEDNKAAEADKPSEREEEEEEEAEASEQEEESADNQEEEQEEEEETQSSSKKRQRAPAKKKAPPRKRSKRKVSSDESEAESEEEEEQQQQQPKKKKTTPSKPAAKTKKADSSSNSKTANTANDDSSDDDEPLIKMVRKAAPSEEQLRETVRRLLEEASLEDMTMKQICQRVFDTFPEHDLSGRKDFIKHTVKSLIT